MSDGVGGPTGADEPTGKKPLMPVEPDQCRNCGRRFLGEYCPECGQQATPPTSPLGVLSVFFRELVDIEGGLWPSMWALTTRPGKALSRYLGGARQHLMHPGRYLLASIVVAFGADRVFTWLGMRTPYDERVSGGFTETESSEVAPETEAEIQSLLVWTSDRVLESQAYLIATNLVLTGFLSLAVWRLFRRQFERGAQAVAFSALVVGHTVFLCSAFELLYVPADYMSAGPSSGLPVSWTVAITAVYVVVAATGAFGGGWKSGAKGLLAIAWAGFEQALAFGIVVGCYLTWMIYARFGGKLSAGGTFNLSIGDTTAVAMQILPLLGVILLPFALHVGLELYYRRQQ